MAYHLSKSKKTSRVPYPCNILPQKCHQLSSVGKHFIALCYLAKPLKEEVSGKLEDLVAEKGSSAWLTVPPLQDLGFNLNKREFRDAVKLRYD